MSQFNKAIEYIATDSVQNAVKVRDEILIKINTLRTHPEIYSPDKYKTNNNGNFRAFELHRYRVAFHVSPSEIRILRVRHTSRIEDLLITLIMPHLKKDTGKSKSKSSKTVIVTKTKEPAKSTLFAKKLKKVNSILAHSVLLPS
ncbi:MAG: type toxin-antitoxin system RelE/ParE family toxin [Segetibacter sp.]|nr:type toxin-antitoxin system RelE/ParE family toxin [Segetibacter sp.]